jgi:hypothetical protein
VIVRLHDCPDTTGQFGLDILDIPEIQLNRFARFIAATANDIGGAIGILPRKSLGIGVVVEGENGTLGIADGYALEFDYKVLFGTFDDVAIFEFLHRFVIVEIVNRHENLR